MALSVQEESIVVNLLAKLDERYAKQAMEALEKLTTKTSAVISTDISKALNSRIKNVQDAISAEIKLEEQRRVKELASLKVEILERNRLRVLQAKQVVETNKQISMDAERQRKLELASLKADIISRANLMQEGQKSIGALGINVVPSGAYTSLTTGRTTNDAAYRAFQEAEKAAAKAGTESGKAYSKTFWGAIEGGTTFGHKIATTFQYATAGSF